MINLLKKSILNFMTQKRFVIFLKKYSRTNEKAKHLMNSGDINAYLKQLIETEKSKKKALALLVKGY